MAGNSSLSIYNLQVILILLGIFAHCHCLFEDQVGKFDWHQSFVGNVKFGIGDASGKRCIVATEANVLAALSLKTGNILWRQVLERDPSGQILFMSLTSNSEVLIIFGGPKPLVRAFHVVNGALVWEWSFPSTLPLNRIHWAVLNDKLYAVVLNDDVDYTVHQFNIQSGTILGKWQNSASWTHNSRCNISHNLLICYSGAVLHTVPFFQKEMKSSMLELAQPISGIKPVKSGEKPGVFVDFVNNASGRSGQSVLFSDHGQTSLQCQSQYSPSQWVFYDPVQESDLLLQLVQRNEELLIVNSDCASGDKIDEFVSTIASSSVGIPQIVAVICGTNRNDLSSCRLLLHSQDEALTLLHYNGKVIWTREEALSSISVVEMLDLPVSDQDAAIEKEFDNKEEELTAVAGALGMFGRRLVSQALQVQHFVQAVFGLNDAIQPAGQRADLVRDDFGLHKMIVVATDAGKIFGLDNLSGEIIWQQMLMNVDTTSMQLFVQRTTRHAPHPAQCALLLKDKDSKESILYTFNPITGVGSKRNLHYRVLQAMLLPLADSESLRPILLLDSSEKVHIEPQTALSLVDSFAATTYMYVANPNTGIINGYSLSQSTSAGLVASRVWNVVFQTETQTIVNVVGKNPQERVHSQGRVLGDRSVLYKYVNPNLVAVVTKGTDILHKYVLNVYLLDVVSGAIVFSISHKRARAPIHLVHTENWVVYSYFSEKWRRTEMAAIELYEGKSQSNSQSFSSLIAPIQPLVERQSYILPAMVQSIRPTVTEKGITSRHILVGLANGAVLEVPWIFLDPRRPVTVTPELREEGVIPYMPELPISSESYINYNKSLPLIKGIHTAPSGLESTSLVLVYGLDIFYTRVAPSKTFDLLKEDFDPFLISLVLIALGLASYFTKRLASRKALKQAWKC